MATIGNDPNGFKRVLFVAPDGKRKTIRLGKVTMRQATAFKVKVEALIARTITGVADDEVSRWLAGLDSEMYGRLAAVGLVPPRAKEAAVTLGPFLDGYITRRTDVKPRTRINLDAAKARLLDFFGADKPLRDITPPTPTTGCSGSACATPTAPPAARLSAPSSSSAPRSAPG